MNRVWVGDITYVPLKGNGFLYLAMLMDLYSRRIVGWELASNMKEPLVLAALRSAIASRQPRRGPDPPHGSRRAVRRQVSTVEF